MATAFGGKSVRVNLVRSLAVGVLAAFLLLGLLTTSKAAATEPGPASAYSFDAVEGGEVPDFESNHTGASQGAVRAPGKYGSALDFEAEEEDIVRVPWSESAALSSFTVEAWVEPRGEAASGPAVSGTGEEGPEFVLSAGDGSGGGPTAALEEGGTSEAVASVEGPTALPSGSWTYVALTCGAGELKLYVGTELVGSEAAPCSTVVLNGLTIGGRETSESEFFNGAVDEVRLYERALDASELQEDALTPVQAAITPQAQPDDAYSFEEGYGHSTTRDIFGSADASLTEVEWTSGREGGNALQFYPEREGFLTVPEAAAPDLQEPFAIETLVEPQFPSATSPVLVERSPSGDELAINVVPDTERGFGWWTAEASLSGEGPTSVVSATSSYFSYEWEQVAVSSDGEHLSLYLNGELEDTASIEEMAAGKGPLYGGGDPGSERYPQESIDDLRIYHHAIDQAQVMQDSATPLESPRIVVYGPLWESSEGKYTSPNLSWGATVSDQGATVDRVNVSVDGTKVKTFTADELEREEEGESCTIESCAFFLEFEQDLPEGLSDGEHTLEVEAVDSAGNTRRKSRKVTIDGEAPILEVEGSLVEAEGHPLTEGAANLEIRGSEAEGQGQSGLSQLEIKVDGKRVELESYWPENEEGASLEYEYLDSEWGSGPRTVEAIARDSAGNETVREVSVNRVPTAVDPECGAAEPALESSGSIVTDAEAEEVLAEVVPSALGENEDWGEGGPSEDVSPAVAETNAEVRGESSVPFTGTITGGRVPTAVPAGATIGQVACVLPTTTTAAASPPVRLANGSGVLFPNSGTDMDTLVRPTALGADLVESLRGPSSPSRLEWQVSLKPGQRLAASAGGGVAVLGAVPVPYVPEEEPTTPEGSGDPGHINSITRQVTDATADVRVASYHLHELAEGVIPAAVAIMPGEGPTAVPLELGEGGNTLSLAVPAGASAIVLRLETAPDPVAMCAQAHQGEPKVYLRACGDSELKEEAERQVREVDWAPSNQLYLYTSHTGGKHEEPGKVIEEILEPKLLISSPDGASLSQPSEFGVSRPSEMDISPSGELITYTGCGFGIELEGGCGIYVKNLETEEIHLVTALTGPFTDFNPTFGTDSDHIYFYRTLPRPENEDEVLREIWSMNLEGSEKRQVTDVYDPGIACHEEHPCQKGLLLDRFAVGGSPEEILIPEQGALLKIPASSEMVALEEMETLPTGGYVQSATFNDEGTRIAYGQQGSSAGLYEMSAEGTEIGLLAKTGDGDWAPKEPVFSPNGNQVAFVSGGSVYETGTGSMGLGEWITNGERHMSFAQSVEEANPAEGQEAREIEEGFEAFDSQVPNAPFGPQNLHSGEITFCLNPKRALYECGAFFDDKNTAEHLAFNLFHYTGSADNTIVNAFQHGYWTALMVRDSKYETNGKPDGLVLARLHEGDPPYSKESEMDFINDRVGANYWEYDRFNHTEAGKSKEEVCEGLLIKAKNAQFIPAGVGPMEWTKHHAYYFRRLVYYLKYSNRGTGIFVRPTGHNCREDWEE